MEPSERQKLQNQYRSFTDAQILSMLADGPGAYVEGAYALLAEEGRRRGLEVGSAQPLETLPPQDARQGPEEFQNPAAYVQIAIINSETDRKSTEAILESAGIDFNFAGLHMNPEVGLPAGLMVEEARVEDAIRVLKDFKPSASIILW